MIMDNPTALILAGGLGTRIKALYPEIPKPMIPVAGKPFLEWVIQFFKGQGINSFIISIGHLAYVTENYFRNRSVDNASIATVTELSQLGTAGAIMNAREYFSKVDPIIVSNGDSLALINIMPGWEALRDDSVDAIIFGIPIEDASQFGSLLIDENDLLKGFLEKRAGTAIINSGVYIFKQSFLERFPGRKPLSLEQEVFPEMLEAGTRIKVIVSDVPFIDMGTPEGLAAAEDFVKTNLWGAFL